MASQNPPQKRLSVSEKIANNPTKRPHLPLSEKYEVVKKVEATGNKSSVARDFNLKPQSVDYIILCYCIIKSVFSGNRFFLEFFCCKENSRKNRFPLVNSLIFEKIDNFLIFQRKLKTHMSGITWKFDF